MICMSHSRCPQRRSSRKHSAHDNITLCHRTHMRLGRCWSRSHSNGICRTGRSNMRGDLSHSWPDHDHRTRILHHTYQLQGGIGYRIIKVCCLSGAFTPLICGDKSPVYFDPLFFPFPFAFHHLPLSYPLSFLFIKSRCETLKIHVCNTKICMVPFTAFIICQFS